MLARQGSDDVMNEAWLLEFQAWHHDVMTSAFDLLHESLQSGSMGIAANATAFINQSIQTTLRFHFDLLAAYGEATNPDLTAQESVQRMVVASEQAFNDDLVARMKAKGWDGDWVALVES